MPFFFYFVGLSSVVLGLATHSEPGLLWLHSNFSTN